MLLKYSKELRKLKKMAREAYEDGRMDDFKNMMRRQENYFEKNTKHCTTACPDSAKQYNNRILSTK